MLKKLAAILGVAALAVGATAAFADNISGAGATFPAPIYARWAADYQRISGDRVNYQAIGSGAGIRQIQARTVTFGASDNPMRCCLHTILYWNRKCGCDWRVFPKTRKLRPTHVRRGRLIF